MAYDLEEQEQIAQLKAWWNQYGNLLIYASIAALVTVGAYQGWRAYRSSQVGAALALYEQLESAQRGGDHKKALGIADQITSRYSSTPYAAFAALAGARSAFSSGDIKAAETQLRWLVENAREAADRDFARLRLAGVLLDGKRYPDAMAQLEAKPVDSLSGLYAEMKGDVLVAQGRSDDAHAQYQIALDKSESGSTYRATLQLKLDALGTPATPGPAAGGK